MSDEKGTPATTEEGPPTTSSPPSEEKSEGAELPTRTGRQKRSQTFILLLTFLLVSQVLLLVVIVAFPYWWAALPILSMWGVVGWKRSWLWSLLVGFLLGFGYWGVQLLALPAGPRGRLAAIVAMGVGGSSTVALLVGPLLFGLLTAFAALTVAGGLRIWDDTRKGSGAKGPRSTAGN